jgi:hypothetical protein
MTRALSQLDEWPRHQTLDTFTMVASDSDRWSDGSWICVGAPDGSCHLITAIRFYPNTNVVDGYAIVTLDDGKQYNLRVSRRLRPNMDEIGVGPLWMEIVEGLRTIRFGASANESGIEFDLQWDGASPCHDEVPGVIKYEDGRVARARSNYVQLGHVNGHITVNGRRFEVGPEWMGARDHSWGIGDTGTGNQPSQAAPAPSSLDVTHGAQLRAFGMRQFSFVRFPERTIVYRFHCAADGTMSATNSRVDYPYGSEREGWSYRGFTLDDVTFVDGVSRVATSRVSLTRPDGGVDRFAIRSLGAPVYMKGGGYWDGFDDGRGRGVYRAELHLEHDVYDVSHPTIVRDLDGNVLPQRNGAWAETIAIWENLDDPTEVGIGEFEAVVGGPYPGVTDQ